MGKKTKPHSTAGKDTHTAKIKIATKLLFQILQCIHHLANIGDPNKEGIKAKAFLKKQKELDKFVQPAQDSFHSEFRKHHQELTFRYLLDTLASLRTHYLARMSTLCIEIQDLGISDLDLANYSKTAIKWGRNNFRSKLRTASIAEFQQTVQSCIQARKHDNFWIKPFSPHRGPSDSSAQGKRCVPPAPTCLPSTSATFTAHSPLAPASPTATNSSISILVPNTPQHSPLTPAQHSLSTPTPVIIPATPPSTHTPTQHSPPTPNTAPTPAPAVATGSTTTTNPSTNSPTSPPQIPSYSSKALFDPKFDPIDVQGSKNSMSNFFPCKFESKGYTYRDTETAYHVRKAVYLNREDVATELRASKRANNSKVTAKQLKFDPDFRNWLQIESQVMTEILRQKAVQVPQFRQDMLSSYPQRITHNVPDPKWGSPHLWNGKQFKGQDLFARLLMKVRLELLVESGYFGNQSSSPQTPKPSAPVEAKQLSPHSMLKPPQPNSTHNRFSPLLSSYAQDFPPLASPPVSTPPVRRTRSAPKVTSYPSLNQNRARGKGKAVVWQTPNCSSEVVILGDSNTKIISSNLNKSMNSIEIHSWPGAKTRHFHKEICTPQSQPQVTPDHVILSVGINDRGNNSNTHRDQIKKSVSVVKRTFPKAELHIPLVNYSTQLTAMESTSLDSFNSILEEMAEYSSNFSVIPKLDPDLFNTTPDGIHWTIPTANALLQHWLSHLN